MADTPLGEVMLYDVRLSFADLFEPGKPQRNSETGDMEPGKFKANGLMMKGDPQQERNIQAIKSAAQQVREKQWGVNQPTIKPNQLCLRDGDLEDWEGYKGHLFISANNKNQPVLITKFKDNNGKWIPAKPGDLWSGCYVNMLVRIWAQDNTHGKRINASIEAVQFSRKGDAFGGGGPIDADEKFKMITADEGTNMGTSDFQRSTADPALIDLI